MAKIVNLQLAAAPEAEAVPHKTRVTGNAAGSR
jgi:hypothetical protein